MSCFKLPKDVCEKLTSVMIEFWWSSGSNRKKIPWVAWKKLCTDKECGGLGFKDIEKFNQALLAKQAWRIWKFPNSLLARILKQRYFKRTDFLECGIGSRPSYAWRSIMHGRELLKEGLVKKIGNGRDTRVWLDNWLLDTGARPPRYRQDAIVDLTLTVSDLIDEQSRTWNEEVIRQVIAEEDVNLVLNTKFTLTRGDYICWGLSSNGHYDSKSGYKLLDSIRAVNNGEHNVLPPLEKQLWNKLWKTKTSPKLRHFLWRALSGALAVKTQLRSRGIQVDTNCPVCHQGPETICHLLFHCSVAREVWQATNLPLPPAGWSRNSVFLNLHYLISCSQKQSIGEAVRLSFPWVLWQIWKARNKLCFEQTSPVASRIVSTAIEEAVVWLKLHDYMKECPVDQQSEQVSGVSWRSPPPEFLKCNIGSSWSAAELKGGASWIVRDTEGKVMCHSRRSFSGVISEVQADIMAISWASSAMTDLKLRNVLFEFSSMGAVEALKNPLLAPSSYQLCYEVFHLVYMLPGCSLHCVPELSNSAATKIALSVTRDNRLQSYMARNGPRWLSSQLSQEAVSNH